MRDLNYISGKELIGDPPQAFSPIFHASLGLKDLLSIGDEIGHNPLVAIICERDRVYFSWTIASVEPIRLAGIRPGTADTTAHKHQVAFLRSQDWTVPIHDGECVVRTEEDITRMQIRMACDEVGRSIPHILRKLLGAVRYSLNFATLGRPKGGEMRRQRVIDGAMFYLGAELFQDRTVLRRVGFKCHTPPKILRQDYRMYGPQSFAERDPLLGR